MGVGVSRMSTNKTLPSVNYQETQIFKLFENSAELHPKSMAVITAASKKKQRESMSYEELNRLSTKCAKALMETIHIGTRENAIFVVSLQPSPTLLITLLGIWKAGGAYLVIDSETSDFNISEMISEVHPVCVIFDDSTSSLFESVTNVEKITIAGLMYVVNKTDIDNLKGLTLFSNDSWDSLACILYTSGRKDPPKAVKITHKGIWCCLAAEWYAFPFTPQDKFIIWQTPLISVQALTELWSPLVHGLTVLMMPVEARFHTERNLAILEEFQVNRFYTRPNVLASILDYCFNDGSTQEHRLMKNVSLWFCGGELLMPYTVKQFYEYFDDIDCKLYNTYSCTEISGPVSYYLCSSRSFQLYDFIPIADGPIPTVQFYVVDENLQVVPPGTKGELCISGRNITQGYLNTDFNYIRRNLLSKQQAHRQLFMTGDYCVQNGEVYLYLGRKGEETSCDGRVLNVADLEKFLSNINLVSKAVVLKLDDMNKFLAFIKLVPHSPIESKKIIEQLLATNLKCIAEVIIIEHIPISFNGKVNRYTLLKCYNDVEPQRQSAMSAGFNTLGNNENGLVNDLFDVVMAVTQGANIPLPLTLEMNFFENGITSLQGLNILLFLNKKGYTSLSLNDLISCKTLKDLVDKMTECRKEGEKRPREPETVESNFKSVIFKEANKMEIIRFIRKVVQANTIELDKYMESKKFLTEFSSHIDAIWDHLKDISFIVQDSETSSYVGFALNLKSTFFPEIASPPGVTTVFKFYEYLLAPLRSEFFSKSNTLIMMNFLTGFSASLKPGEHLSCIQFIENEKVKLAEAKNFANILCIHVNPLMQTISREVFFYRTLQKCTINTYQAPDYIKPFLKAPANVEAIVQWRILSDTSPISTQSF